MGKSFFIVSYRDVLIVSALVLSFYPVTTEAVKIPQINKNIIFIASVFIGLIRQYYQYNMVIQ